MAMLPHMGQFMDEELATVFAMAAIWDRPKRPAP